jgi:hypothetical protein
VLAGEVVYAVGGLGGLEHRAKGVK